MSQALKYCDVETDSARLPHCQFRAATIHARLASLNYSLYLNQVSRELIMLFLYWTDDKATVS